MKKAYFFEINDWERFWICKNFGGYETRCSEWALGENRLPAVGRDIEIISVGDQSIITDETCELFPKLELIAVRSRDCSKIDLAACRKRKITVCRIPKHAVHAVAEFTFALILALSRNLSRSMQRSAKGTQSQDGLRGSDIYGKTLGIIGMGNIGGAVAKIAKGFGMYILAWSAKRDLQRAAEIGLTYAPLEDLLAHSDVITLHLPYVANGSSGTHHFLNSSNIKLIKKGALLINTAHEYLVEDEPIAEAVKSGRIGGAAFDRSSAKLAASLLNAPNVIFTPQTAFNTQQAAEQVLEMTRDNILAYFKGFPQNLAKEETSKILHTAV